MENEKISEEKQPDIAGCHESVPPMGNHRDYTVSYGSIANDRRVA